MLSYNCVYNISQKCYVSRINIYRSNFGFFEFVECNISLKNLENIYRNSYHADQVPVMEKVLHPIIIWHTMFISEYDGTNNRFCGHTNDKKNHVYTLSNLITAGYSTYYVNYLNY